MNDIKLSKDILDTVRNSAFFYARALSQNSASATISTERIRILTGYKCEEADLISSIRINQLITLITKNLISEQSKSRKKSPRYSYKRHVELQILCEDLKKSAARIMSTALSNSYSQKD